MNLAYRKTINLFNHDIKTVVTVLVALPFIVDLLVGLLNSFEYMLKWWWIMPAISVVFLILFATSEPFKLWMISRKDLKENKILTKEIVVGEFSEDIWYDYADICVALFMFFALFLEHAFWEGLCLLF